MHFFTSFLVFSDNNDNIIEGIIKDALTQIY